jgi:CDGSH-type Zn-finger protein
MVTIKVRESGSYRLEGGEQDVKPVDWNGHEYAVTRRPFALCRCDSSANRPFCDGTRSKIGFKAAEAAVPGGEDEAAFQGKWGSWGG